MAAHGEHTITDRAYFTVFGLLLGLTALTVIAAFFHFGHFNDVIALAIAGTKATLVILYFMQLRYASGLTRVFIIAGFFWLSLLMLFTLADLVTRVLVTPVG